MERPSPNLAARLPRALTLLLLLSAGPAAAQGFTIPELGIRENAMGASIGRDDEVSAIYQNPASLTMLKGTQLFLSMGTVFLNTDIRLRPWTGSEKYLTAPLDSERYFEKVNPDFFAVVPMLGASTSLFSDKLVAALAFYVPNAAGASLDEDAVTRYHMINAYVVSAFTTLALAYKPLPWLAVGLGGSVVYIRIHRQYKLYPVFNIGGAETDLSSMLGTETEIEIDGEDVKPAFHFGLQVWPHRTLSLGFMMLSRFDVSLEGPLRLKPGADASGLVRGPDWTENEHRTEVISPWIFAFGANWDITPWLEVGAELRYYMNSLVKDQRTTLTSGEVLPTVLTDGIVTPKNHRDNFHAGGGFNIRPPLPIKLEIMTGFNFENSPTPNNTVEVGAPTFDLWAYHIGGRWQITPRYRVGLVYSHYWYLERTITDSLITPPTNFQGHGSSNMLVVVLEGRIADGIAVGTK